MLFNLPDAPTVLRATSCGVTVRLSLWPADTSGLVPRHGKLVSAKGFSIVVQLRPFGEGSDTTSYQPYDPAVREVFAEIKALILARLPGLDIEHVGSTSIPGVGGRNVVDIAIAASEQDHASLRSSLQGLGFERSPFPHYLPLLVARVSSDGRDFPVLLYVVDPASDVYTGWILFRDYLRVHSADAVEYDRVKRHVVADGNVRGDAYQAGKTPFIHSVMKKAVAAETDTP